MYCNGNIFSVILFRWRKFHGSIVKAHFRGALRPNRLKRKSLKSKPRNRIIQMLTINIIEFKGIDERYLLLFEIAIQLTVDIIFGTYYIHDRKLGFESVTGKSYQQNSILNFCHALPHFFPLYKILSAFWILRIQIYNWNRILPENPHNFKLYKSIEITSR